MPSDERHRDHDAEATEATTTTKSVPRLKQKYHDEIKGQLKTDLDIANVMQVPALVKIVVNMGVGRATQQPSLLERRGRRPHGDHRPEADHHQGQALDRRVQAPRGPGHRHQGHAAG